MWEHAAMAQVDARQTAPRLERSRRDRWVAGVAGGIGHHIGVQTSLVRVAFVVLSFAAGFGLVVYILTWLLAPLEAEVDGAEAPPRRIRLPSAGRAIGIGSRTDGRSVSVVGMGSSPSRRGAGPSHEHSPERARTRRVTSRGRRRPCLLVWKNNASVRVSF